MFEFVCYVGLFQTTPAHIYCQPKLPKYTATHQSLFIKFDSIIFTRQKSFQFVIYCLIRFTQIKIMIANIRRVTIISQQPLNSTFKVEIT